MNGLEHYLLALAAAPVLALLWLLHETLARRGDVSEHSSERSACGMCSCGRTDPCIRNEEAP